MTVAVHPVDVGLVRRAALVALVVVLFAVGLWLGLRAEGFPGTHVQFEAPASSS